MREYMFLDKDCVSKIVTGLRNFEGVQAFLLVDAAMSADLHLTEVIARERNVNREKFFDNEYVTILSTSKYLLEGSATDQSRVLFVLKNSANQPMGQFGFKNISTESLTLDAVIKYRAQQFSMRKVIQKVLNLLKENTTVKSCDLEVRRDNTKAIELYRKLGFVEMEDIRESTGLRMQIILK